MAKDTAEAGTDIATFAINSLDVSIEVKEALHAIQMELTAAYQTSFSQMLTAIQQQSSALARLQNSMNILVSQLAPQLKGQLPVAIQAVDGPVADLASALVVADPIGAGYTMTQAQLAEGLRLKATDVSILVKHFHLHEDEQCAVVVRRGKRNDTVNYHPRALKRFKELFLDNELGSGCPRDVELAWARVRKSLK